MCGLLLHNSVVLPITTRTDQNFFLHTKITACIKNILLRLVYIVGLDPFFLFCFWLFSSTRNDQEFQTDRPTGTTRRISYHRRWPAWIDHTILAPEATWDDMFFPQHVLITKYWKGVTNLHHGRLPRRRRPPVLSLRRMAQGTRCVHHSMNL